MNIIIFNQQDLATHLIMNKSSINIINLKKETFLKGGGMFGTTVPLDI